MYRSVLLLILCSVVGACVPSAVRPYPAPQAAEVISHLRSRSAALLAMRAQAKADYLAGSDRVKITVSALAARPDRLRISAENSLTGPLLSLVTDDHRFQLLDVQRNRFLSGEASPCNIARLIRVELRANEAVEMMMGGVALLAETTSADTSWDPRYGGREVLTLHAVNGQTEVVWLSAKQRSWDVLEAELRDPSGHPIWRVRHEDFSPMTLPAGPSDLPKAGGSVRLPAVTYIEDPPHKSDLRLRWKARELNPTLPQDLFHLDPPPGVPGESATCAD